MRATIIRIGNSRGIRIPKALLEECGLGTAVELEVEGDRLVLRRAETAREGWDDAFREMHHRGDDALVDGERAADTLWDETEWEW